MRSDQPGSGDGHRKIHLIELIASHAAFLSMLERIVPMVVLISIIKTTDQNI
jgi:hypothetical protein